MPMIIRQIHTTESLAAVNKIKAAVKNDGLGMSFDVPKEFIEKRRYMQSDAFLKDEHNVKMFEYGEKLGELREKIGLIIKEKNKDIKDEIVQGINGFARIKKYLDINPKMNFSNMQTFHYPEENSYSIIKNFKIENLARQARNKLGIR